MDTPAPPRFGAVLTAMVTPFGDDGSLDLDAVATLARWLVEHGSDGLVIAGTTGESPTITIDEQIELFGAVRGAVDCPVIAGAGSNDTAAASTMHRAAGEAGVDAILSVTPYYNRPSQDGLYEHFKTAAAHTDLPVMLYDIPVRSGRKIETSTLLRLFDDVPNIVAVKDAAGNPAETARLIAQAGDRVEVYSGDDAMTLPLLAVGAVGVVSVASHWVGPEMSAMVAAFRAGDVDTARSINQSMLESFEFETGLDSPNPIPTKAMLRHLGLPVGACRPPMGPEPKGLDVRAAEVWDAVASRRARATQ